MLTSDIELDIKAQIMFSLCFINSKRESLDKTVRTHEAHHLTSIITNPETGPQMTKGTIPPAAPPRYPSPRAYPCSRSDPRKRQVHPPQSPELNFRQEAAFPRSIKTLNRDNHYAYRRRKGEYGEQTGEQQEPYQIGF